MAWIAAAAAAYGAYSANRQRRAQREAEERASRDYQRSLEDARAATGPWADVGRRTGLYRLASLMGDDRFGSTEAMELYDLKEPDTGKFSKEQLLSGKVGPVSQDYINQYRADLEKYNKRKAELEAMIAKQKAEGTYRVGSDYLFGSTAYKNRFNQGQSNVLRSLAAHRGVLGGGQLKDLEQYGQEFASNEFDKEYNRLANLAGIGQVAATQGGQWGMGTGQNLANLAMVGGNAVANYYGNMNNVAQGTLGNMAYNNERRRSSYRTNNTWADYENERGRS